MEPPFEHVPGVKSMQVGYSGGHIENPTYDDVSSGKSGHLEVIRVIFDPSIISYEKLLDIFWHNIDPTTSEQQFCDIGRQYQTAIFYHNEEQKMAAEKSKALLKDRFHAVATEILPAAPFYPAEEYHQGYHKKNPLRYGMYKKGSGRESKLDSLWNTPK